MGAIIIDVQGSFDHRERKIFSAMDGGHSDAVAQAIEYLVTVQLRESIRQDHKLQGDGVKPRFGFGGRLADQAATKDP